LIYGNREWVKKTCPEKLIAIESRILAAGTSTNVPAASPPPTLLIKILISNPTSLSAIAYLTDGPSVAFE